jgi:hypothetical protein
MNRDFCDKITDELLPLAGGIFLILVVIAIMVNEVTL